MGVNPEWDLRVRAAAFDFLKRKGEHTDDTIDRVDLLKGFELDGQRIPLVSPQGIFTPAVLDRPLSISTTAPKLREPAPYDDEITGEGRLVYRYRGTDPMHRDNVGLRNCMKEKLPLIYFYGLIPGKYMATWPIYIVGDNPAEHAFYCSVEDKRLITPQHMELVTAKEREYDRRYLTIETKQRLHQRSFRERVLAAYQSCCAICRLKHAELLDAAHIISDGKDMGDPVIPNGIALCKLHHAAFDRNILGIRPDLILEIREDILREHDGPMLKFGLQEIHGQELRRPKAVEFRPDQVRLEIRYEEFRAAG